MKLKISEEGTLFTRSQVAKAGRWRVSGNARRELWKMTTIFSDLLNSIFQLRSNKLDPFPPGGRQLRERRLVSPDSIRMSPESPAKEA